MRSMRDFVASNDRLSHSSKFINESKLNFFDVCAILLILILIGGL